MEMIEEDSISNINIAPLVDVCLVLLLVFMVTMPLSGLYGVMVKSNKLSQYGLTTPQDHVVIHLATTGIAIEDDKRKEQPVKVEDFGAVVRQMIQLSATREVMLKIDPMVSHGQSVWALDVAKQNGASSISILEGGAS
ncbi:MAG: biopolymer transporter ExbD [Elusimicrobia bacterium]|nr:biopolymer transporter ExbD [Elusimicrobiota bacterium]